MDGQETRLLLDLAVSISLLAKEKERKDEKRVIVRDVHGNEKSKETAVVEIEIEGKTRNKRVALVSCLDSQSIQ